MFSIALSLVEWNKHFRSLHFDYIYFSIYFYKTNFNCFEKQCTVFLFYDCYTEFVYRITSINIFTLIFIELSTTKNGIIYHFDPEGRPYLRAFAFLFQYIKLHGCKRMGKLATTSRTHSGMELRLSQSHTSSVLVNDTRS